MKQPLRKAHNTMPLLLASATAAFLGGTAVAADFYRPEHGVLGPWHAYALQAVTPAFARGIPGLSQTLPTPTPGSVPVRALLADLEQWLPVPSSTKTDMLVFDLQQRRNRILAASTPPSAIRHTAIAPGWAMKQQLLSSGFRRALGEGAWWQVSAVLASQQFQRFQSAERYETANRQGPASLDAPSYGAGLRIGLESRLLPRFSVGLRYQTRIDMDALTTYRGLFNKPADFDIPAHASVLLRAHPAARHTLTLEAQRIQYSQVDPFSSYLLPDRFTSLLGDGGSPEFSWNDLTVYNLSWSWQPDKRWQLEATWGTGNQPSPSSSLLYQALVPDYARQNLNLDLTHLHERLGTWSLAFRYAQPEPLYSTVLQNRSRLRDRLAVELNWTLPF